MLARKFLSALCIAALLLTAVFTFSAQADETPLRIEVDISSQIVTIYRTADDEVIRQMLCSTGINDSTPEGVYYLPAPDRSTEREPWYYFPDLECYARWATRIKGGYLFHSIPYDWKSSDTRGRMEGAVRKFGYPASHGCIRLLEEDAEYIAKNCGTGTRVDIIKSGDRKEELRKLLYISSYTQDSGMTYKEFLGVSEMSKNDGNGNSELRELLLRLNGLGYYDGDCENATYDVNVIAAVKNLQKDLGMRQNGVPSDSLKELIFSDDAPIAENVVALSEGMSGPVVTRLQSALKELQLYDGPLYGVYDVALMDSMKIFQSTCYHEQTGIATTEEQQLVYHQLELLQETFGDMDYTLNIEYDAVPMGTISSELKIILRSKPSTESLELGKLVNGQTIMILEDGDDWIQIAPSSGTGYIRQKYVKRYSADMCILRYTGSDGATTFSIGHTFEEYKSGAATLTAEYAAYAQEQLETPTYELRDCVTVDTGSDDVTMNLRAEPDKSSDVLIKVANGASMFVISRADGWTRVGYQNEVGYLMDDYLSFWQGTNEEIENNVRIVPGAEDDTEDSSIVESSATQKIAAVVIPSDTRESGAVVFDQPTADAQILGSLEKGTSLEVLKINEEEGWALIRLNGHEGYMFERDLQFQLLS